MSFFAYASVSSRKTPHPPTSKDQAFTLISAYLAWTRAEPTGILKVLRPPARYANKCEINRHGGGE